MLFCKTDSIWIGAHDIYGNDTFYWLDGSAVLDGYNNIDILDGGEDDALFVATFTSWNWRDEYESDPSNFICERDISEET